LDKENNFRGQDAGLEAAFRLRANDLMKMTLHNPIPDKDISRRTIFYAIIRLGLQVELDTAYRHIAEACINPGAESLFVRHACIDAWFRFGQTYSEELSDIVKRSLLHAEYYCMEGGTENHKIMNAVTGYLTAQAWPDWVQATEVKNRCLDYMDRYFARVVRYGQGEFDSTTYSVFYLNTLATLYDFSNERFLRTRAGMMMDWFLANTAGEWLNGLFTGAHSRDYHPTNSHCVAPAGTTSAWLYLGGRVPNLRDGEPHYSVINALSTYRPPDILVRIAQDRTMPYEHWETHDVVGADEDTHDGNRTHIHSHKSLGSQLKGYGYISRAGVRKYTYMTSHYALGSLIDGKQGDVIWSGQMRRWSLDWDSDKQNSVLLFNHPCPDFGNPEEDYVASWQGSSPYEQVIQHEGTLIALYQIPRGTTYQYGPREPFVSDRDPYIDGFFSGSAIIHLEEAGDGWIYGHCGTVLFALRLLQPYRWLKEGIHRRLRSEGLRNAVIVETARPEQYSLPDDKGLSKEIRIRSELGRFRDAVHIRTTLETMDGGHSESLSVTYKGLAGNVLQITYDGARSVNGVTIPFETWPLLQNPYLYSELGSGKLAIRYHAHRLNWDFNDWTIKSVEGLRDNGQGGYAAWV
jgi:hypothetical protein